MKLSIVIPVYNVENYLRKCLDSVIYPDLGEYEIIIVNDGSTDSSAKIAAEYAEHYPSLIRLISISNGGLGHARNIGLEASGGEYVAFLDSDDTLSENAVAEMLEETELNFDICIFDFVSVNEAGRQLQYVKGCPIDGTFTLEQFPALLHAPPAACNKLYRRSLFIESGIRFPGRVWYEDLRTTPKLYLYADKICSSDKAWYVYLQRSGSITNSKNTLRNLEIIEAVDDITGFYRDRGVYEKYRDELVYMRFFHQLISAVIRVNQADWKSPVQSRLLDAFWESVPDYANNRYIKSASTKYKILFFLIKHKAWLTLNALMKLNNTVKRKDK